MAGQVDLLAAGGARRPGAGDSVDDEVCRGKPWNAEGGLDGVHQDIQAISVEVKVSGGRFVVVPAVFIAMLYIDR